MNPIPRGILLLDKPIGVTSFQALGACKRYFGTKKIGHAGTLDRFASGLLLVFVAEATRLVPWFVGLDKRYRALIRFGVETDTLDPEGEVIKTGTIPSISQIENSIAGMLGAQLQVPPAFSAIHVEGKRAYERTLAGETFELKPRPVTIQSCDVHGWADGILDLSIDCTSGTYVRSYARDLGFSCGTCAHLVGLRRERIGDFTVFDALAGTKNRDETLSAPTERSWMAGRRLGQSIPGLPTAEIIPDRLADFRNGKPIRDDWFDPVSIAPVSASAGSEWSVVCSSDYIGIIKREESGWVYRLVFPA